MNGARNYDEINLYPSIYHQLKHIKYLCDQSLDECLFHKELKTKTNKENLLVQIRIFNCD